MKKPNKIIVIGLDGVPFDLLSNFSEAGIMPNTAKLISKGIFRKIQSTIPEVSSVAWSSIITGKNPGEHGIFGFMDTQPNSYKLRFPNFNDLKAAPFWDSLGGKAVIVNVPSTYPVKPMNGIHISGFVSIDLERSVYPQSLIPKLKELDYRLDVDAQKAHQSMDLFLSDLDKALESRIQTYRYLWNNSDWQTFMLVFTGTDRLMHFLWEAYEDKNHKYHNAFIEHFAKIDEVIGEISSNITDDDLLIVLSDHGFEGLDKDIYVNYILNQERFLKFNGTPDFNNIDYSTKAFALDPARIYLNLKGKYPLGSVDPQDREEVLRELEELFSSLEVDGRKVVKSIYRKEDIYSGPFLEQAPDLVLVSEHYFNLKSNIRSNVIADKTIFTGKHTPDTAFLLAYGLADENIILENFSVADTRTLIDAQLGAKV